MLVRNICSRGGISQVEYSQPNSEILLSLIIYFPKVQTILKMKHACGNRLLNCSKFCEHIGLYNYDAENIFSLFDQALLVQIV